MIAVTVIDPAATGLVGISPDGVDYPGIMLFDAGQNVSASMIVPVDPTTGTITVVAWAATDLAIDVIGSFTQPTRTWRYDYDTSGLRSAKELETADGTGVEWRQEHTWTAAGGLPLLLAEHQGSATSYLVYGPGGTPIYQINHTGEVIYLHQDHQGSTRLVTNANGTVRGAMAYDAHGRITVEHESVDPAAADGRLHRPVPRHRNRLHLPESPSLRPGDRPIHQPRPPRRHHGGAVRLRQRESQQTGLTPPGFSA
jgi:YD repeat-containing protein